MIMFLLFSLIKGFVCFGNNVGNSVIGCGKGDVYVDGDCFVNCRCCMW